MSTQIGQRTHATQSNWHPNVAFEALGANHNEYGSHTGTFQHLERIFEVSDSRVPAFFRTLPR